MEKTMEIFDGMTITEIETFIKDTVKPALKERKVTERAELMVSVKNKLHEGDFVIVRWKDSEVTGTVVSLREKTFSILTDEILNAKGDPSRISRGYDFVLDIGDNAEDNVEEDTEKAV